MSLKVIVHFIRAWIDSNGLSSGLKISSKTLKLLLLLSVGGLVLAVSGCATILSAPEEHSPRALASLQLTEQGRILLESGDPDNAISIFERAININPTNGQNYYYLSEAWLLKGDTIQAKEFNQLAEIHLEDDHEWMRRVLQQRERIEERSG
jgi:tetratricopeptide (TPR) repeat protein